jgi:tripartite-type tricarboxylate transporter receptor subunit TctC
MTYRNGSGVRSK